MFGMVARELMRQTNAGAVGSCWRRGEALGGALARTPWRVVGGSSFLPNY